MRHGVAKQSNEFSSLSSIELAPFRDSDALRLAADSTWIWLISCNDALPSQKGLQVCHHWPADEMAGGRFTSVCAHAELAFKTSMALVPKPVPFTALARVGGAAIGPGNQGRRNWCDELTGSPARPWWRSGPASSARSAGACRPRLRGRRSDRNVLPPGRANMGSAPSVCQMTRRNSKSLVSMHRYFLEEFQINMLQGV